MQLTRGRVVGGAGALAIAGAIALAAALLPGAGSHAPGGHAIAASGPPQPAPSASPQSAIGARSPRHHPAARPGKARRSAATLDTLIRTRPVLSPGPAASAAARPAGSRPATAPPTTAPPPPAARVPSLADLEGALLTATELPGGGFTAQPTGSGISLGSLSACPELGAVQSGDSAEADASYTGGNVGPDVSETLLQYSVSGAEVQVNQFAVVAQACGNLSVVTHGLTITIGISVESSFPVFGDQTIALRINAYVMPYGIPVTGDIVAVRRAGTVIVLTNVGAPVNGGLTQSIAAAAYAKVAARW